MRILTIYASRGSLAVDEQRKRAGGGQGNRNSVTARMVSAQRERGAAPTKEQAGAIAACCVYNKKGIDVSKAWADVGGERGR